MRGAWLAAVAILLWAIPGAADNHNAIPRIAVLSAAQPRDAPMMRAFDRRLRDLGYVDGGNIIVDFRNAEGHIDELHQLAAELVQGGPAVIVDAALAAAAQDTGAVMSLASPAFFRQRHDLFAAAARHRLPVIYGVSIAAADGALLAYGASLPAAYARAADYVDAILTGAAPRNLPIFQADRFELVVNLRVAEDLGIVVPNSVLMRADEVIE